MLQANYPPRSATVPNLGQQTSPDFPGISHTQTMLLLPT
jgi:hypothetical protein